MPDGGAVDSATSAACHAVIWVRARAASSRSARRSALAACNRARMSAGRAATSSSTVASSVSTIQFMDLINITFML